VSSLYGKTVGSKKTILDYNLAWVMNHVHCAGMLRIGAEKKSFKNKV
jgi:hypothetical protein